MTQLFKHAVLLVLVAGIVFFAALGRARLWDRDEPRNAGCAVEMMQRGDWVVPTFNAELRIHKPVLLYWFMLSAYWVFGVSEFAARFWSAALAVGTVLITWQIGRRLFDRTSALWGGLVLASCPVFVLAGRAATPDSVMIFFTTLATLFYVLGAFEAGRPVPGFFPQHWGLVVAMYASMGMATLAKGPVGFVLPMAVIGMFMLIMSLPPAPVGVEASGWRGWRGWRRWLQLARLAVRPFAPRHFFRTLWSMRPLTAAAVVLAVALPWYVWVGVRTDGAWLSGFLLVHNLGRAAQAMEGHSGGPWYYPVTVLIGTFPWVVVLIPAAVSAVLWAGRDVGARASYLLLLCWVCVYVGLFSLARTKLPSYVTPMYPALALLTGSYVQRWINREQLPEPLRLGLVFGSLALIGVAIIAGAGIAAGKVLGDSQWLGAFGLIPAAAGVVCLMMARRQLRGGAATALAIAAVMWVLAIFAVGAQVVDRHQQSDKLLQAIRSSNAAPRVASFGALEPSWVYYLGSPIREISKNRDAEAIAFLASGSDAFVITTSDRYQRLRPELSQDVQTLASVPYFGRTDTLVVLGRPASGVSPAGSATAPGAQ